jgi:hypothetical protein
MPEHHARAPKPPVPVLPAGPQDEAPTGLPGEVVDSFAGIAPPAPGTVDAFARPDADDLGGYRLALPRGNWAQIASIDVIPQSTFNEVKAAGLRVARMVEGDDTDQLPALNTRLAATVLSHLVTAWSLQAPLPVTEQSLGELPAVLAGRLEAAAERALKALKAEIEPSMDPASPTRPSAGSTSWPGVSTGAA